MAVHRLPDALYDELEALAHAESTSLLAALLAGFLAVLARYTGQPDLAVGTAASGRTRRELKDQVGFHVNMLVLRCQLSGADPTFRELLALASDAALDALGHQDVPFGRLVNALQPDRESNRNPLFQVALVLQLPHERVVVPGLAIEETIVWELGLNPGTSRFDLTVNAGRFGGGFQLLTEYSTELFDGDRIDRLHGHLQTVLEHAVREPDARLSELLPLTEEDRRQLAGWRERMPVEPAPAESATAAEVEGEGPRTPTEEALAELWREVFGAAAEGVGIHESFFAIGGSSLQAVELMTRVQEAFLVELDLRDVFAESSIAQLGALIDQQLGLEGLSDEEVLELLRAEE